MCDDDDEMSEVSAARLSQQLYKTLTFALLNYFKYVCKR